MTPANQVCARRKELQVDHELLRLHLPKKPDPSNQRYLLTQWPLGAERPKATESGVSPDQSIWPINLSLSLPFVLLSCLGFIPQSHFPFCNRPLLILFAHSFSLFIAWRRLLQIQSKIRFPISFSFYERCTTSETNPIRGNQCHLKRNIRKKKTQRAKLKILEVMINAVMNH